MLTKASKILVVDDFEVVRMMLKTCLEELGYQAVEMAEDGRVAFEMLEKAEQQGAAYSLIFSDWNMPNVTGLELLQKCKASPTLKKIPFVMVTAESEQAQVVQALRSGAIEYIVKPFSPDSLQKKLDKLSKRLGG